MHDKTTDPYLALMDATGWHGYVIRRRADEGRAYALGQAGIVSSIEQRPGEPDWRLHLTRAGQALRRKLIEQERANG